MRRTVVLMANLTYGSSRLRRVRGQYALPQRPVMTGSQASLLTEARLRLYRTATSQEFTSFPLLEVTTGWWSAEAHVHDFRQTANGSPTRPRISRSQNRKFS